MSQELNYGRTPVVPFKAKEGDISIVKTQTAAGTITGPSVASPLVKGAAVELDSEMTDLTEQDYYVFPAEIGYGPFEYFSAVGGDPPSYQWAAGEIYGDPEMLPFQDGWYRTEIKLGNYRKNVKIGIRFDAEATCSFKFEVVGTKSPAPAKAVLKSVKGRKKSAVVSWKKVSGAKGYQIQYSKNKDFKSGIKSTTVKSGSTLKKKVSISKRGKYYFRVRAYKKVRDVKVYGKWSNVKKAKVR